MLETIFRTIGNAPIYPDDNIETYLDGYTSNNDVFSIINKTVQPVTRIPVLFVDKDGNELPDAKPLKLLQNPNPFQSQSDLLEEAFTCYQVFGNSYLAGPGPENGLNVGIPTRLDILPPIWTTKVVGDFFNPILGYKLELSDRLVDYKPDEVLHWRTANIDYDSLGRWLYGMSPLKPLLKAMTTSNSGYDSLVYAFQNMGAYGILSMLGEQGVEGKAQAEAVQKKFKEKYSGNSKRGTIVITNQDHKWTSFGLSPVDLNIINSLGISKAAIAEVYGVPTVLLSGSNDKTYANYREGEKILYQDTIIPTFDSFLQKLTDWLVPKYGDEYKGCRFVADYSVVDVMKADIAAIVTAMSQAGVFTKNEIREAVDYGAIEDPLMDEVWVGIAQTPLSQTVIDVTQADANLKALGLKDYREK